VTTLLDFVANVQQIPFDLRFQSCALGKLLAQLRGQSHHLFLEGFAVGGDFLYADVTARRQDVTVRSDFLGGGGFGETGYVFVIADFRLRIAD
jgi:hypothetical protein